MPPTTVIRDRAGVVELAGRCRDAGRFSLDFEFLWERTYLPVTCLAQVSTDDEIALIDPIDGAPLEEIVALVEDPDVQTVMHAPSADLTLLALHFGVRPQRLVDVQLVAGFVGLGAGQSLATLLDRVLGVRLAKAESYSDWSRRPLSDEQLAYAADDVRHLLPLTDRLAERVAALGREEWVAEEHRLRYGPDARFFTDPREAWRKIKGQGRLNGRERAVLREVAAWREQEARRRDRPPAWILQDRLALDIAKRKPATRAELGRVRGLDDRMRDGEAGAVLAAVSAGLDAPEVHLPQSISPEIAARLSVLGTLGQLVVGVRAEAANLAAPLLATRDEVEAFLAARLGGDGDLHPLGSGWRRDIAGDALTALAAGRLAVAPSPRHPYLVEFDPTADGGGGSAPDPA